MPLCVFATFLLTPLQKGHGPSFQYTVNRIPFPKGYFVPCLIEISPEVLRRRFLIFVSVFLLLSLFEKKCVPLHLNKLESPLPKDALCQVWLKLASWLLRRKFLNLVNLFSPFRNHLLLEKSVALHSKKLESSLPKNALCQVWLKLAKWYWRRF